MMKNYNSKEEDLPEEDQRQDETFVSDSWGYRIDPEDSWKSEKLEVHRTYSRNSFYLLDSYFY